MQPSERAGVDAAVVVESRVADPEASSMTSCAAPVGSPRFEAVVTPVREATTREPYRATLSAKAATGKTDERMGETTLPGGTPGRDFDEVPSPSGIRGASLGAGRIKPMASEIRSIALVVGPAVDALAIRTLLLAASCCSDVDMTKNSERSRGTEWG